MKELQFSKGYWVAIHRCLYLCSLLSPLLLIDPSDEDLHCTLLQQVCRVYENTQVDRDEVLSIAVLMTKLYLSSSSKPLLLQSLLELLCMLVETCIIKPSSLFEPILSLLSIPSLIPSCFDFIVECYSIRRVFFFSSLHSSSIEGNALRFFINILLILLSRSSVKLGKHCHLSLHPFS